MRAAVVLAVVMLLAPVQCGGGRPDHPELEDSPPEALWELSERFAAEGDQSARRRTLEHLVERYPTSRFAERARLSLGAASQP